MLLTVRHRLRLPWREFCKMGWRVLLLLMLLLLQWRRSSSSPQSPHSPVMQQHIIKQNAQQPRTRSSWSKRQLMQAAAPGHWLRKSDNRLHALVLPLLGDIIHHPCFGNIDHQVNRFQINQRGAAAKHETRRRCSRLLPRQGVGLLRRVHVTSASAARENTLKFRA